MTQMVKANQIWPLRIRHERPHGGQVSQLLRSRDDETLDEAANSPHVWPDEGSRRL